MGRTGDVRGPADRKAGTDGKRGNGFLLPALLSVLVFSPCGVFGQGIAPRHAVHSPAVSGPIELAQLQMGNGQGALPSAPATETPGGALPPANSGAKAAAHPHSRITAAPAPPTDGAATAEPASSSQASLLPRPDPQPDPIQGELDAAFDGVRQSRDNVTQAADLERKTIIACLVFLAIFAMIAIGMILLISLQTRKWNKKSSEAIAKVEDIAAHLSHYKDGQDEIRRTLPKLLQEVGDQPLSFQEEGVPFPPRALALLDEIDHLAYLGDAQQAFRDLSSPSEAAVYLNGLLLSAVAHLARAEPWTALGRLDKFMESLARYADAVDHHRIAQAYSYRAQAAYQVLDLQDIEPSWLRKSQRTQTEVLSKQAFADIAQASRIDPEWKHATFVEAQLCSRYYLPDEPPDGSSRTELYVRGLRRAVVLYKGLIDEKSYRGPARHNLARCLKRVAEQTGEKSDFSEFGFALSAFPTDEELCDEGLSVRQPASQDRFLWQSMLGDPELFRSVDKLNLAEYRSFWIRLLDNKVHLRNWRADLGELQQQNPAMRDWVVQLLHSEPPLSLANAISRRAERFDSPSSGT